MNICHHSLSLLHKGVVMTQQPNIFYKHPIVKIYFHKISVLDNVKWTIYTDRFAFFLINRHSNF